MKKKIIIFSIISIFVLGLAIAGIYFAVELNKKPVKMSGDSEFQSDSKPITSETLTPDNYEVEDVIAMTLWRMSHTDRFKSVTTGISDAGIAKQQIKNERIILDGNALITCVTYGMIKQATQRYFTGENVLIRKSTKINDMVAQFPDKEPECITNDDYMIRYGWMPNQAIGYIISKDTYLEEPIITKDGNNYKIEMVLDPSGDKAPFYYKREIATNASSTKEPVFKSIKIIWTINSDYYILESNVLEEYSVKSYGIEAVSKTNCTEVFEYENVQFPDGILDYYSKYASLTPTNNKDNNVNALTIITSAFVGKEHNLDISASVNNNTYEGKILLSLKSLSDVRFKALLNDNLYLEYIDDLYIDYYDSKFKMDLGSLDVDVDEFVKTSDLLDSVIDAKVEKIDNNYSLQTSINFGSSIFLDLFFIVTNDYNLVSVSVDIKLFNTNIKIMGYPNEGYKFKEYNYDEFKILPGNLINDFVSLYENNYVNIELNSKISNIDVLADIYIDIKQLIIEADILIKNQKLNVIFKNNTIYLSFNNIKVYKSFDSNDEPVESSVNADYSNNMIVDIIDFLIKGKLKNYIDSLDVIDGKYNFDLNIDILEELLNVDLNLLIDSNNDINIITNLFNTNINLSKAEEKEILNDETYYDISYLVDTLSILTNLFNESFRIDYKFDLDILNQDININGYLDLLLNENNNYDIVSNFDIYGINAKFIIKDNNIYIYLSDISMMLKISELKDFISEIKDLLKDNSIDIKEELDNNESSDMITDILNNIYINQDNSINIDFNDIIDAIGLLTIVFSKEDKLNIAITSNIINAFMNLYIIDNYELIIKETNYLLKTDIISLIDKILKSYQIIKNNDLELEFNLVVYDSSIKTLDASGILNLHYYDDYSFDIKAHATINEYYNLKIITTHYADLLYLSNGTKDLIDDYIYADYYNNLDNNHLKVKTTFKNIKQIISDVKQIVQIKVLGDLENVDFSDSVDLNQLIRSISVIDGSIRIDTRNIASNNSINVSFDYNEGILLTANNIYSKYLDEYNYTRVDIPNIKITNNLVEYKVNDSGYYDLSDLNLLTSSALNTKNLSNIKYSGTLKLKLFDLITALKVPFDINMDLDNLKGHIHLDLSGVSEIESLLLVPGTTDIYFDTEYVYIYRQNIKKKALFVSYGNNDSYYCKITLDTFMDDINYYLFEIAFQFKDTLMDLIEKDSSSSSGGESSKDIVNYTKVLNNYSYNNNDFYFNIALDELTNKSAFGDLSFDVKLKEYETLVIDSLSNVNLDLVSGLINVTASDIKLQNVLDNIVTDLDLEYVTNFIENYQYEADKVYKNDNLIKEVTHKITYVLGLDNDNLYQEGMANELLILPELDKDTVDGIDYKFVGWYLDKNFFNELDYETIGYESISIYAKWVRDTSL